MKLNKKLAFMSLLALTLTLSSCASTFKFENVKTDDNKITTDRGVEYQSIETSDLVVAMHGNDVEEDVEAGVATAITNKAEEDYKFKDSMVSVFEGNVDKDEWHMIGNWNADFYYQKAEDDAAREEFQSSLNSFFAVNDAIIDSQDPTSGTDKTDVLLTTMIENQKMRDLLADNRRSLDYLKSNLLYSSDISENETYRGLFYFPVNNKYPDYKVSLDDNEKILNFYFNRSDREQVLNPWLDQERVRYSVALDTDVFLNRQELTFYALDPHSVGYYIGASFYNIFEDPSDLDASDSALYKAVGFTAGLDFKIASHTWLLTGMEFTNGINYLNSASSDVSSDYVTDSGTASESDVYKFGLQIGANWVYNFIDASLKTTWLIGEGVHYQAGLGIAF
jgi:hypothetical protein